MPKTYEITAGGKTFEVSSDRDLSDQELVGFASKLGGGEKGNLWEGFKQEAKDQWAGVKELGGALKDVTGHLMSSERRGAAAKGFAQGANEAQEQLLGGDVSALDPTGLSSLANGNEPWLTKAGRGIFMGAELAVPALKPLSKLGKLAKAGRQASGSPVRQLLGAQPSTTGIPSKALIGSPGFSVPKQAPSKAPLPTPAPGLVDDTGRSLGGFAGPERRAAAGASPTGAERRSLAPLDNTNPVEAARLMMEENPGIVKQAAELGQRARSGRTPAPPRDAISVPTPQSDPRLTGLAPKTAAGKGQPTKTLAQMMDEYGPEEAARRAGMGQDELLARVGAVDESDMASRFRGRVGAQKAGRELGMEPDELRKLSGGGPSRLPDRAVDGIKAVTDPDTLASPQHQALLARIKNERGGVNPKLLLGGGAAVAGAVSNPDDPLLGGLMGGAAGLGLANIKKVLPAAKRARTEMFLAGGAIPKNIATGTGAVATAALEGTGRSRLAPIKEALRVPTNLKTFWEGTKPSNATGKVGPFVAGEHKSKFRLAPSRLIHGIDETFTGILERSGVPQKDFQRYLLTADNNAIDQLIEGALKHLSPAGQRVGKEIGEVAIPFRRTPANAVSEAVGELGAVGDAFQGGNKSRAMLTAASGPAGYALGEWAGSDRQKQALATIALAMMGSRTAIGTVGAIGAQGRQAFGSVSPVPEWAFDPAKMHGLPFDFKKGQPTEPGALKFWQRLFGERQGEASR